MTSSPLAASYIIIVIHSCSLCHNDAVRDDSSFHNFGIIYKYCTPEMPSDSISEHLAIFQKFLTPRFPSISMLCMLIVLHTIANLYIHPLHKNMCFRSIILSDDLTIQGSPICSWIISLPYVPFQENHITCPPVSH